MRYLFGIAVSILILTGCQPAVIPEGPWIQKIDSEEFSYLVINYSAKMQAEKRLRLEDSWICYDKEVKKFYLRYSSQAILEFCEARLLMVELVEGFLERLNHHALLRYQLEHYPFTADDLDVKIDFESFHGLYVDPLYIGLAWLKDGCVKYFAFERKDPYADWDHHRIEPYAKSREFALIKKEADLPFMKKEEVKKDLGTVLTDGFVR